MIGVLLIVTAVATASLPETAVTAERSAPGGAGAEAPAPTMTPIIRVPAKFPADAPPDVSEGWVVIEFTVNEQGSVENARAVQSSHDVFEEPAVAAVSRYKYRPRKVGGKAVRVDGIRVRITFKRPPPISIPSALWKKRQDLALSSGHTVSVMPPRIDKDSTSGHVILNLVIYVLFDFSSQSSQELRSMAREILEDHSNREIGEMIDPRITREIFATVRFVAVVRNISEAENIPVKRHADVRFLKRIPVPLTPQRAEGWLNVY